MSPIGVYPRKPLTERFWAKVDTNGPIPGHRPELGPCWLWTGTRNTKGYGQFYRLDEDGRRRRAAAHRVAYELEVGSIPEGLEPDHLCRVHACVRPSHIEPVTHRENTLRGAGFPAIEAARTHCPRGHEYTPDNTYRRSTNERECRQCTRIRRKTPGQRARLARANRDYRARRREQTR